MSLAGAGILRAVTTAAPRRRAIAKPLASAHMPGVLANRLFALFIALSLLFGPLAMDRAMAATPADHSQMAADSHCQPPSGGKVDKAADKPCCTAMCATAAVVPEAGPAEPVFTRLTAIAGPAAFHRGILAEIATPPPRAA